MYSAVSARTVEIATLRHRFRRGPAYRLRIRRGIAISAGRWVAGAGPAYFFFDKNAMITLSGNFTQLVVPLTVTPGLAASGIVWALSIGFLGGRFPAIRAARLPISSAFVAAALGVSFAPRRTLFARMFAPPSLALIMRAFYL
jgi:putative ABC transport system permease protein